VKAGLFLLLIEALVWLSMPAMALLKPPGAMRKIQEPKSWIVQTPKRLPTRRCK
jgi:hypothetical protein